MENPKQDPAESQRDDSIIHEQRNADTAARATAYAAGFLDGESEAFKKLWAFLIGFSFGYWLIILFDRR